MALDPTPWMIAGGAQHSADLGRTLAFAATSGEEGVVLPESLKVTPQPTPGSSVRIAPGACLMLNRSLASPHGEQSYVGRAGTSTTLAVPSTGGVGRTDLVVVRVEDPQYAPWQTPSNPVTATYFKPFLVQNVPANTRTAAELNLGYPAVALARLVIPASTTAITSAMIYDVREVAQPRSKRALLSHYPGPKNWMGPGVTNSSPGWNGTLWPYGAWTVDVPVWATRAVVVGTIAGAKVGHPDSNVNGDIDTVHSIRLGGYIYTETAKAEWLTVVSPNTGLRGYMRGDITTGGVLDIPASMRGATGVDLRFMGDITAGLGEIYVDIYSTLLMDIEFQERAV